MSCGTGGRVPVLFICTVRRAFLLGSLLLLAPFLGGACKPAPGSDVNPQLAAASEQKQAIEVHDALEAMIQAGTAVERDRQHAYEVIQGWEDGSASYAFARGALAGRLAEERGLAAIGLVKEAETWARKSIERDPNFRDGAATRMLGTLYVLAGDHVEHGDSEEGLELLEDLVAAYPNQAVNHLRLAEGYISLGDPEGGYEAMCKAIAGRGELTREEDELLTRLIADVGGEEVLGCPASQ